MPPTEAVTTKPTKKGDGKDKEKGDDDDDDGDDDDDDKGDDDDDDDDDDGPSPSGEGDDDDDDDGPEPATDAPTEPEPEPATDAPTEPEPETPAPEPETPAPEPETPAPEPEPEDDDDNVGPDPQPQPGNRTRFLVWDGEGGMTVEEEEVDGSVNESNNKKMTTVHVGSSNSINESPFAYDTERNICHEVDARLIDNQANRQLCEHYLNLPLVKQ